LRTDYSQDITVIVLLAYLECLTDDGSIFWPLDDISEFCCPGRIRPSHCEGNHLPWWQHRI